MISIGNEVRNVGYVHLSAYEPGKSTEEVLYSLGTPLSLGTGSPVHQLTPKPKERSTPNTYSGIFGYSQFPLHTDLAHWRLPPRFMVLRCIRGFSAVSTLLDDRFHEACVMDQADWWNGRVVGGFLVCARRNEELYYGRMAASGRIGHER